MSEARHEVDVAVVGTGAPWRCRSAHSVIVNAAGRRFVNEALNYNDLMKPFHDIDPNSMMRPNLRAWLIVDQR